MSPTLYGIPGCDTVRKARAWLDGQGVAYAFHDYKKAGIERERLAGWADRVGWEALFNRSGTTFRKLPDADKHGVEGRGIQGQGIDRARALALMAAHPSIIRRPVLEHGETLLVGFRPDAYRETFGG